MLTSSSRFLFPTQSMLETSAYTFSGNGSMHFSKLNGPATKDTTYANAPTTHTGFGMFMLAPGNAYKIADFACPAGEAIGIWMNAVDNTALNYFQDFNPCRESHLASSYRCHQLLTMYLQRSGCTSLPPRQDIGSFKRFDRHCTLGRSTLHMSLRTSRMVLGEPENAKWDLDGA